MVTVSERLDLLNNFLASLARHEPDRHVFVHMQGENRMREICWAGNTAAGYLFTPEHLGCHAARVLALQALEGHGYDSYVNVDDDVQLLEHTHWQPAIDKAREPGVGFVLTNWIRSEKRLERAVSIMGEDWLRQVMVYNGGGMAYTEEIAALIRELDPVPARYDDIWPVTAYVNGYNNYRYRGSLALHAIMGKGGMNSYMRTEPRPLLCWDWINYRPLYGAPVGSDYAIPADADLRPVAHLVHKQARARRGWE
jgi:hypothetical protein